MFANANARRLLRSAIARTRAERPWETVGLVLLPDHLHTLWRLNREDLDYSVRVSALKKRFTRAWLEEGGEELPVSRSRKRHRDRGIWQRRFWEHCVRDAGDLRMHLDYIHLNPVKHGFVSLPRDWPWSSFHRYVREEAYEPDWCGRADLPENVEYFCE